MNMNQKKRVMFELQQTAYFSDAGDSSSTSSLETTNHDDDHDEYVSCWYSDRELHQTRDDAFQCILSLQKRLIQEGDNFSSISIDALEIPCPHDPSQLLCLRGIEKYADAAVKFAGQKNHVRSVLRQQAINNKREHMALVSRTLSQPFKDVARYYALKSAEEQEAQWKQEAEQSDVAPLFVLYLAIRRKSEKALLRRLSPPSDMNLLQDSRSTSPEMVSTSTNGKRARDDQSVNNDSSCCCNFNVELDHCSSLHHQHCRNVKPCTRVISE
jgi:hypothetical protein